MPNQLAETKSLYLRKHAHNPINWYFWGEKALNTAKNENKPIFLSIGYSSCHWCTVMENEAFSNQAIANYLNDNFIAIKIDREERPDLDSIYMQALQMMTGQGGWPLNIFITPDDLVPFYGGTYFPINPSYGRPGFLELLESINDFYHQKKDKLNAFKEQILEGLHSTTILTLSSTESLNNDLLNKGIELNTGVLNRQDFGHPRFPMIPYSNLTLQGIRLKLNHNYDGQKLAIQRGKDLANGGIYDHAGGGFHRYTVDATWTVPHFEKMLYDNGLIIEFLANLWSFGITKPEFKIACEGTFNWLKREMTAPEDYFYAAQDADNFATKNDDEPEEGAFYVWHYTELEQILNTEELGFLKEVFPITENGNFEGKIVLQKYEINEDSQNLENFSQKDTDFFNQLKEILDKLFKVRYGDNRQNIEIFPPVKDNEEAKNFNGKGRIPPVTDTKMITAWNSLMISGLARSYGVFGDEKYLNLATKCANFILNNQWQNNRFYRLNYNGEVSILAQSEDYAFFIKALLDLYNNNPENNFWLDKAQQIQQEFNDYFWCIEMGGFYNNSTDNSADLLIKERSYVDNATPSANGVAIANLVRLGLVTENTEYLEQAYKGLQAFSAVMAKSPTACPSLINALDWYLNGKIVKSSNEQIKELISLYFPTTMYQIKTDLPNNIIGLVCQGLSCLEPALNKEHLLAQIKVN
jgi:uncharacterized protein YyaL (SSP411 family)